jgi:hypothetical protein
MTESVEMVIPPAGSSEGSWKLLIVTPGRPLNAFKVIVFDKETPLKIVPRAVTLRDEVEIVQSKLGLCSKYVANEVNLTLLISFYNILNVILLTGLDRL